MTRTEFTTADGYQLALVEDEPHRDYYVVSPPHASVYLVRPDRRGYGKGFHGEDGPGTARMVFEYAKTDPSIIVEICGCKW